MAALPILMPRKTTTPIHILKPHHNLSVSPLQTLLQLGFPKHRAEKALAATGNRGVQIASDWLLTHVNDVTLDECTPREYILYACPTGPFLRQLEDFWSKSRTASGWNGAHNYVPHITLVSFFKAPDESSLELSNALKKVTDMTGKLLNQPMKLEKYISQNFIGFFVAEEDANYLKHIALQYVKEVSNLIINETYEQLDALVACFPWCSAVSSGNQCILRSSRSISFEPPIKSLHLTLAYQFPKSQLDMLNSLVGTLDTSSATTWELRLYSRDPRLATKQVNKVIHPHCPNEMDELALRMGDCIYVNADGIDNSCDGWDQGISWLTGNTGYFPTNYTERTAESDAWTLHRAVQLSNTITPSLTSGEDALDNRSMISGELENVTSNCDFNEGSLFNEESEQSIAPSIRGILKSNLELPIRAHQKTSNSSCQPMASFDVNSQNNLTQQITYHLFVDTTELNSTVPSTLKTNGISVHSESASTVHRSQSSTNRKVLIMRHGERVDFTFGTWIPYCFDEFSTYVRKDLNMPKILPRRRNCPDGWQNDSPLTNIGIYQAKLIGEALHDAGVPINNVYCSPAFRCVQTCANTLQGLKLEDKLQIKLEPGLFEWMAWYPDGAPDWMRKEELLKANYNVDTEYNAVVSINDLNSNKKESTEEFYTRNNRVLRNIITKTTGNILLVAHATTLDTCTRQLVGQTERSTNELRQIIHKTPYCSLATIEEINGVWTFVESDCMPLTHSKNPTFEWNILTAK